MRLSLLAALLCAGCAATAPLPSPRAGDQHDELARAVLAATPLVDGHNDLPWAIRSNRAAPHDVAAYDLRARTPGHTDIPRLRAGRVGVQFWSVYTPPAGSGEGAARTQLEQLDIAHQLITRYPDAFELALTADQAMAAFRRGRIASALGLEGGHSLENSLGTLRAYYQLGARYLTLTHSANTDWADAATDTAEHGGLTEFGREVVRELNRLGMLVDLAHVSDATMSDALDVTASPVIFSHSSARAVTDNLRNVPDSILRRVPRNGGIVMVTFVPAFVNDSVGAWQKQPEQYRRSHTVPRATMADVIRHIEHVRAVAGSDHVGIGGDFDGIERGPEGLEDVASYPALFAELSRRGWSEADLRKLAGENLLRVWRAAEAVAARLQRERGPSTRTIEQLDGR